MIANRIILNVLKENVGCMRRSDRLHERETMRVRGDGITMDDGSSYCKWASRKPRPALSPSLCDEDVAEKE